MSRASLGSWTPGIIDSVDAATRVVRVQIPGLTDGAQQLPEADICYPVGDDSRETDRQLKPGALVWLDFVGGNPKYPIITGYRCPQQGNAVGTRHIAQQKIELVADTDMALSAKDGTMTIKAGTKLVFEAPNFEFKGEATFSGPVTLQKLLTLMLGLSATGGDIKHLGVSVGSSHAHNTPAGPSGGVIP
jgi:hypothetical protein